MAQTRPAQSRLRLPSQALQVRTNIGGAFIALVPILLHRAANDVFKFGWQSRVQLEVSMNDAFGMGCNQRICDLNSNLEKLIEIHRLSVHTLLQALTFQLLHDNEGMAIVVVNIVNRADVGMIQLRGSSGFALKAL